MSFRQACLAPLLWLQELPEAEKRNSSSAPRIGVFRRRFCFGFVLQIVDVQIWLRWGEELGPLQVVEIRVDFCAGKESPNLRHKRWQLGGELGMLLRGL